jgi:hypothetical protein
MQRIFVNLNNKRECASIRMDASTTKTGKRNKQKLPLYLRIFPKRGDF